jgi:general nucleoside transport system permease protein
MPLEQILTGLAGVLFAGAPIVIAVMGETLTERSGVINLSLNGVILLSAMIGFWAATASGLIIVGFLAGALIGALVSLIVAFSSITLRQSQVAVGFILALTCRDLAYFLGQPDHGCFWPDHAINSHSRFKQHSHFRTLVL